MRTEQARFVPHEAAQRARRLSIDVAAARASARDAVAMREALQQTLEQTRRMLREDTDRRQRLRQVLADRIDRTSRWSGHRA